MPMPRKPRATCPACGREVKRAVDKYCDNRCQQEFQYTCYIQRWLAGEESGLTSRDFKVSVHVKRWLLEQAENKCSQCGWAEIHPNTGRPPLQIHHIDGDILNNRPDNLQVLCPNCHSLTPTYGMLNVGKGKRYTSKAGYYKPG